MLRLAYRVLAWRCLIRAAGRGPGPLLRNRARAWSFKSISRWTR